MTATLWRTRFNTQPPEGGCGNDDDKRMLRRGFNTQPPEGGCDGSQTPDLILAVSTHSRPKAAASIANMTN